jgi:hypothetical protein
LDFCEHSSIEVKYVSVAHPWANGQVEHANGLILDGLKKRLYDENSTKGGKWINEISSLAWGLRTQPSKATRQSSFFLVYGSEAILLADVMWKSPRLGMFEEGEVDNARHLELDSSRKIRCNALLQSACYLQGVHRYHEGNVQQCSFNVGDMVLRRIQDNTGLHKLNSQWEGPFIVHKVTGPDLIAYSILIARRYLIPRILSMYVSFILDQLGTSSIGACRLILPVQLHFTGLRLVLCASLLKGPRSHVSSN